MVARVDRKLEQVYEKIPPTIAFIERVELAGLTIEFNNGATDCMFTSFALLLLGSKQKSRFLRKWIVEFVQARPLRYNLFGNY